ncbi:MAG: hypothetical protein QW304_05315 [Thermoproteota archaeon]
MKKSSLEPYSKHLHALFLTVFIILMLLPVSISSWAQFSIISVPGTLPQGKVGESYSVKFKTTLPLGYKVDWSCNPANPVPGLSFSTMSNVEEITLSGTPTQAGTFKFKLRAQYKTDIATAEFTITITPYFSIIVEQTEPVDPLPLPPRPRDIYEGDHCRFDIYTDHPDGLNAHLSWTVTGAVPDLRVKPLKGHTLTDSPGIFLEGNATTAGEYWVTVTAVDTAGHSATTSFPVIIHPAYCIFNIRPSISSIEWNTTVLLYPRATRDEAAIEESMEAYVHVLYINISRFCRGSPSDVNITTLYMQGLPDGITVDTYMYTNGGIDSLGEVVYENGVVFLNRGAYILLNNHNPSVEVVTRLLMDDPLKVSHPYPGRTYSVRISAVTGSGEVKSVNITLRVFHYVPRLNITGLRPVSQYPNPHHTAGSRGGWTDRNLAMGKQTVFRFNYTLDFPYAINVTLQLSFPSSEWDWRISEMPSPFTNFLREKGFSWFIPSGGAAYSEFAINETFTLPPTRRPLTRFFFAEKLMGETGIWYPTPKTMHPSVTLTLVKKGRLVLYDEHWNIPLGERVCFSERFDASGVGNLKLGYFIMDRNNYTEQQMATIHSLFPDALKRYITGIFPVNVKEVRWMRYVGRPYVAGFSTRDSWIWDADTFSEEIADANLDRGVVIVPNDALDWRDAIGVVFHGWGTINPSRIAFVEYYWAVDGIDPEYNIIFPTARFEYFPVVAHELSHTLGYHDIYYEDNFPTTFCTSCVYYGYTDPEKDGRCSGIPLVLGYWAYFDEINGGLIRIGKPSDFQPDIMACGGDRYNWAYHSYGTVRWVCAGFEDPPDGLLVSLLIFRNGTVVDRPFTRLFNHSQPFLLANVTGNSYLNLISRSGALLRSYPLNFTDDLFKIYGGEGEETDLTSLVAVVEWFNDLGRIEFLGPDGKVWFSRTVSLNEPKVSIEYPFQGMKLKKDGTYGLRWSGSDADGDGLWFNIQIKRDDESSWMIIAHRTTENSVSFTVPESFEEGNYVLMVKATDGVNTGYDIINLQVLESLPVYTLNVSSNVGIQIAGSGTYEEWSNVTLTAPQTAPVEGFLGILGGKYVFQEWTGFTNTRQNTVSIIVSGEEKTLTMNAIYAQDLTVVYIVSAVIFLIALASAVLIIKRRRKPVSPPASPSQPA